jgi:precorrin-8X/cobalt-precorrin-8 methylmutase
VKAAISTWCFDMSFEYQPNPHAIEQDSFRQIRQLTDLSGLSDDAQQVVMRVVHSVGDPLVAQQMRISANACAAGREALANHQAILCDVEMVKQGITKRMIQNPPLCYLNHEDTAAIAKQRGETRSMAALDLWGVQLAASVVVIGNAPTALFRLLEMIKAGAPKPALIVGIPVGFVGAAESKQALWDIHEELGIECITLLGRQGGSAAASSVVNALMRCNIDERY